MVELASLTLGYFVSCICVMRYDTNWERSHWKGVRSEHRERNNGNGRVRERALGQCGVYWQTDGEKQYKFVKGMW